MISIIVAIAQNQAIGINNQLLWHMPADLKRFKQITLGHPVIMGKKTYESLPKKPLPGRKNIVLTDDPSDSFPDCITKYSVDETISSLDPAEESFVIGGASVYKQSLPLADRLYLTMVHKDFQGDVFFPEIDFTQWDLVSKDDFPFDDQLGFSYSYVNYRRRK